MLKNLTLVIVIFLTVLPCLPAQEAATASNTTFEGAGSNVEAQLQASLTELNALREQIAQEKVPLGQKLSELEEELTRIRADFQQKSRLLDSRTLDLTNLRTKIKSRQDEAGYLSNLFAEYIRNFESRLHISELQRYRGPLEGAKLAAENNALAQQQVFETQSELVSQSLLRLEELLGGARFKGTAVNAEGLVKKGEFMLLGPVAYFASEDGMDVGLAEQKLGSLEPTLQVFKNPLDENAVAQFVSGQGGTLPFDPTLGSAYVVEGLEETLVEHIKMGGPVMIPILILAAAALLVAVFKWLGLLLVGRPSSKRLRAVVSAIAKGDKDAALAEAKSVGGPTGAMLFEGIRHSDEPRELVEEVMYEVLLATRLKLQRFLPFIAVSAASAPLLGLLGTVTGIINTFKMITVFGTGDVKSLSSGISEALITTEFGLLVAIPSLLIHALLSRKAKGIVDQMEKAANATLNEISRYQASHGRKETLGNSVEDSRDMDDLSLEVVAVPSELKSALSHFAAQLRSKDKGAAESAVRGLHAAMEALVQSVPTPPNKASSSRESQANQPTAS